MTCRLGICFLLFTFWTAVSYAQEKSSLDSLAGAYVRHIRASETEQLYLVTNKTIYTTEDAIWFRAFLLRSISLKLSTYSKNVFVDMVNGKDSVVSRLLLNAANQQLSGKISLSDSIPTGYYWLRAYTAFMASDAPDKAAVEPVYVINHRMSSSILADDSADSINMPSALGDSVVMQYFPEGGSIITGANTTVGIRISNVSQRAIAVRGYIKDNADSVASYFVTDRTGLGKFTFYPSRFRKYTAHIIWNGKEIVRPLPPFNFFTAQVAVLNGQYGKSLRVLLEDSIYKPSRVTYLLGMTRDSLCFAGTGTGNYELPLPEEKFPDGIATFSLFDVKGNLLSRRSILIHRNSVPVHTSTDKAGYFERDKVLLEAEVKNNVSAASFAVAVADSTQVVVPDFYQTIQQYFKTGKQSLISDWSMLHADINDAQKELLLLCLLQKHADSVYEGYFSKDKPVDSLLFIKGTVMGLNNKPVSNEIVTLFSRAGQMVFSADTTKKGGRFLFQLSDYPDSSRFTLQLNAKNGRKDDYYILLDRFPFPSFTTPAFLKRHLFLPDQTVKQLKTFYVDTTIIPNRNDYLKTVIVKTYRKKEVNYDEKKRVSLSSKIIAGDQLSYGGINSVLNAVLSVPGVQLFYGFLVIGGAPGFGVSAASEPLIIIDGIDFGDSIMGHMANPGDPSPAMSLLKSIDADDVDFIEILSGPEAASYGMRGGHGVIIINTKYGRQTHERVNNLKPFIMRGYYSSPEFPFTDYSNAVSRKSHIADHRSVLYWKGNVLATSASKFSQLFYTSDVPSTYLITITGITEQGQPIFEQLPVKVNSK